MTEAGMRTRDPDRKSKILVAAADLIANNGYHSVSLTDIGTKAGITGSGIYRHFDGKAAILVALFEKIIDDLLAEQSQILGDELMPMDDLLRALIGVQMRFVLERREVAKVYYSELQSLPDADRVRLRRKQRLYLEEWVHLLREVRSDLDDAEARALVHAAIGVVQSPLFHNVGLDEARLSRHLMTAATAVLGLGDTDVV